MLVYWNIPLVLLSVFIAMVGSFTALTHAKRMRETSGQTAQAWMIAGGITLGLAIWSMHFIGMLAFHLSTPLGYDLPLTLLSAVPGIGAAMFGLYVLRESAVRPMRIVFSSLLMGAGISAMHYTGMAAITMSPPISYDVPVVIASVLMAILASLAALLMVYQGERSKLSPLLRMALGSVVMGLAISGMHYSAMLGMKILPGSVCLSVAPGIEWDMAAMMVTLVSLFWFGGGMLAVLFDQRMARQNAQALAQLERVHMELQAQANEVEVGKMRIGAVLDTVADGIITIDPLGTVESFNPAAERVFGFAASEVIGRNVNILMPEPYHTAHDGYLKHFLTTGEARIIGIGREVQGRRKDGSTFPMELAVTETEVNGQRFFTGIARDISERMAAETKVKGLSLRLDLALRSAQLGVWDWDVERNHLTWDHRMYELYGVAVEQFGGAYETWLACLRPDERARCDEEMERVLRGEKPFDVEFQIGWPNGTIRWIKALGKGLKGDAGQVIRVVGVNFDITVQQLAKQALVSAKTAAEQANLAKDDFLACMSHEIRTPLGGLMGMLELLSFTTLSEEQHDDLEVAQDSARNLLRILDDLLDWSKIEAGKLGLSLRPTSIAKLLSNVVNTYAGVASAKGLVLEHQLDARLSPGVVVDPLRLSQVLNNYVSNALKFTEPGGHVLVGAEFLGQHETAEQIRFSVSDTGVGISEEVQRRLFGSYSQGSADTARMYGGTGLGLAICERLAALMDGHVGLESTVGQGSTFSLTLTLEISEAEEDDFPLLHAQRPAVLGSNRTRGVTHDRDQVILVVDDHPTNRQILEKQIALLGLRTETASNGEAALALWRGGSFAMVITDCHMPQMDGYELSRTIRSIEANEGRPRTPILAWTANALPAEEEKCQAAGMDEVLVKPVNLSQLADVLSEWLQQDVTSRVDGLGVAPDASTAAPAAQIDMTAMDQIASDATERGEILRDFITQTRSDLTEFEGAGNDLEKIGRLAHRVKGACRMVGARELETACESLESAVLDRNLDHVRIAVTVMNRAMVRLEAFLSLETDGHEARE